MQKIKDFFGIDEQGTTIPRELLAGLTTFLAMLYILPVNAGMLSTFVPSLYGQFFLATAISAIVGTLIMGLWARKPFALAPGMGVNAFFTFTAMLSFMNSGSTPTEALSIALGAVLISGILFLIISVTGLRELVIKAIPRDLKFAVGAGIGGFLAFIGLKNAEIIVADSATFVALGDLSQSHVWLALLGILMVLVLHVMGNTYAIFITMVTVTIVGLGLGLFMDSSSLPTWNPDGVPSLGLDQILFVCFDNLDTVLLSGAGLFAVFTFLFVDFFDTAGTLVACGEEAELTDSEGNLEYMNRALFADSAATVVGAMVGTSTTTTVVESAAGVKQGGRTGLTAVTVAILFGLALVLYPVFALFNSTVTAVALIFVGFTMMGQLSNVEWDDTPIAISSLITILMMVLTYSISEGIAFGFLSYTVLMVADKRANDVGIVMYILSLFFIVYFVSDALM